MQFSISDYSFRLQTVPASARVAVFCDTNRVLAYDIGTATWYDGAGQTAQADAGDAAVPATCADWALPKTMPPQPPKRCAAAPAISPKRGRTLFSRGHNSGDRPNKSSLKTVFAVFRLLFV